MQFRLTRLVALLGCAAMLSLAACGSTSTVAAGAPPPTDLPAGGAVTPSPTLNGCPTQSAPANASTKPDVLVTRGGTQLAPVTTTIKVGQHLRVQLPANILWHLSGQDPNKTLQGADPFGYYVQTGGVCIWDLTALKAGTAQLAYSGGLVCAPNTSCPAIAQVADFTIVVQ